MQPSAFQKLLAQKRTKDYVCPEAYTNGRWK